MFLMLSCIHFQNNLFIKLISLTKISNKEIFCLLFAVLVISSLLDEFHRLHLLIDLQMD